MDSGSHVALEDDGVGDVETFPALSETLDDPVVGADQEVGRCQHLLGCQWHLVATQLLAGRE
jgi:hypothetical protein